MKEYTAIREHLQNATSALSGELDSEILETESYDPHAVWPLRAGDAKGSIKSAKYTLHSLEGKQRRREGDLTELLANAVLGWICDQLTHEELEEKEVNRFIRDLGGDDLKSYSTREWRVMGAPPHTRAEGDILVGVGKGEPVVWDLLSCERLDDLNIIAFVDDVILEGYESARPYDTLEEANV